MFWCHLVDPYIFQHIDFLSMTTKATPLSAVSTTREESSLRVLMASFSCLVMLRRRPFLLLEVL